MQIKIKENEMPKTTKVKIKVTEQDIVEGVQQDCMACPVLHLRLEEWLRIM
jgi:hypothetical protein